MKYFEIKTKKSKAKKLASIVTSTALLGGAVGFAAYAHHSVEKRNQEAKESVHLAWDNGEPVELTPEQDKAVDSFINELGYGNTDQWMSDGYNINDLLQEKEEPINFLKDFDVNSNYIDAVDADEIYDELAGLMNFTTNTQREDYIEDLFVQAGYARDDVQRMPISGHKTNNVYVVKKGTTDKTIVIGGHLDKVSEPSKGIIDNGSGSTLVTNLAQSLRNVETKYTYVFVGFGEEETGLNGAKAYVSNMTQEEKKNFAFMANFDCVGVDGIVIYENISNKGMNDTIEKIADQRGFKFSKQKLSPWYGVDSLIFRRAGLPSGSHATHNYEDKIHNGRDVISNISKQDYHDVQQLATDLVYVAEQSDL